MLVACESVYTLIFWLNLPFYLLGRKIHLFGLPPPAQERTCLSTHLPVMVVINLFASVIGKKKKRLIIAFYLHSWPLLFLLSKFCKIWKFSFQLFWLFLRDFLKISLINKSFCNILKYCPWKPVTDALFIDFQPIFFQPICLFFMQLNLSVFHLWFLVLVSWLERVSPSYDYFLILLRFLCFYLFFFFFIWISSVWHLFWLDFLSTSILGIFSNSDITNHVWKSFSHWFLICPSYAKSISTLESFWK